MAARSKHVCSGCIELFDPKDLLSGTKDGSGYSTYFCADCIKKLGIKDYEPYLKKRVSKKSKEK
jgi:hypothetical protein